MIWENPARTGWNVREWTILLCALLGAVLMLWGAADEALAQAERPDSDGKQAPASSSSQRIFLPYLFHDVQQQNQAEPCPLHSTRSYSLIPVDGPPTDHPDVEHADLNLGLRGYAETRAALELVNINGPTDGDPPQLPGIFPDLRTPDFRSTHRVYDWDWSCGQHGCRGDRYTRAEVSLLGLAAARDEPISSPNRRAEIYGGGFKVLVLYAEVERITLGYTRHDTVAAGYTVHMERICVDPALVALYQQANRSGRAQLPALHNGDILGTANGEILVAVRDRGTFMDPRSRKDWWKAR